MEELFPELIGVVVTLLTAYCFTKAHDLGMSPFRVSVYNFVLVILFIFMGLASAVDIVTILCWALACHFILVGSIHLITNDSEKYKQDARVWINSMTLLIGITGVLMLAIDYPNTKSVLHPLAIGFTAGFIGTLLNSRKDTRRKEENL